MGASDRKKAIENMKKTCDRMLEIIEEIQRKEKEIYIKKNKFTRFEIMEI